jgi:N-acetylmuramoyl-L-alanine amidase
MTTVIAYNDDNVEIGRGEVILRKGGGSWLQIQPASGPSFWAQAEKCKEYVVPPMEIDERGMLYIGGKQVPYYPTASCYPSFKAGPYFLVEHYTAGTTLASAIQTFQNKYNYRSAHVVVDADATAIQMVPFTKPAWHAGDSLWGGLKDINYYSIGIEYVYYGWLKRKNNQWERDGVVFQDDEVLVSPHQFGGETLGWPYFPEAPLDIGLELSRTIYNKYNLCDLVGHEDVSLDHKVDPGPAFPMAFFREQICGTGNKYVIGWPGGRGLKPWYGAPSLIAWSWCPMNTLLEVLEVQKRESKVRVLDAPAPYNRNIGREGWIETRYLLRTGN